MICGSKLPYWTFGKNLVWQQDHKKIQEQMMNEKQTLFALKPSPLKVPLSSKKVNGVSHTIVGGNGPQPNRRLSPGCAIPQPGTPKPSGTNGLNVSQQRKWSRIAHDLQPLWTMWMPTTMTCLGLPLQVGQVPLPLRIGRPPPGNC
jgi:hypothetical protein